MASDAAKYPSYASFAAASAAASDLNTGATVVGDVGTTWCCCGTHPASTSERPTTRAKVTALDKFRMERS